MAIEHVSVTEGAGKDIAVDTVGGVEYQIIKIALGAEDAMDIVLDSAQQTMANSLPVVLASNQTVIPVNLELAGVAISAAAPLPVQTRDNVIELTLVLDAGVAYATGEVLSITQELASFFPVSAKAVTIQSISVLDEDHEGGAFDIVFLKSNVSIGALNAAVSVADADAREILGVVSIALSDYADLVNSYLATITGIGLVVKSAGTSIWVAAISRDTKTYTAASDLKLKIGII